MAILNSEAAANDRLEANGRQRQWIRDAEALFVCVTGASAGDMFDQEKRDLAAEADEVLGQMIEHGWICRVSATVPTQAICACCDAVGMIGARQLCPRARAPIPHILPLTSGLSAQTC